MNKKLPESVKVSLGGINDYMPIKFAKMKPQKESTDDLYFKKKKVSQVESLPSLSRDKRNKVGLIGRLSEMKSQSSARKPPKQVQRNHKKTKSSLHEKVLYVCHSGELLNERDATDYYELTTSPKAEYPTSNSRSLKSLKSFKQGKVQFIHPSSPPAYGLISPQSQTFNPSFDPPKSRISEKPSILSVSNQNSSVSLMSMPALKDYRNFKVNKKIMKKSLGHQ